MPIVKIVDIKMAYAFSSLLIMRPQIFIVKTGMTYRSFSAIVAAGVISMKRFLVWI